MKTQFIISFFLSFMLLFFSDVAKADYEYSGTDNNDKIYFGYAERNIAGRLTPSLLILRMEGNTVKHHVYTSMDAGKLIILAKKGNDLIKCINNEVIEGFAFKEINRLTYTAYTLRGGPGKDEIHGTPFDDNLYGDGDDDYINGYGGNDYIRGGWGNDHIIGHHGNDELFGDPGNDFIAGWGGNDQLNGGRDNDFLCGDSGNDNLNGYDGDDILVGGTGTDTILGGEGTDTFRCRKDDHANSTYDGSHCNEDCSGNTINSDVEKRQFLDPYQDWVYKSEYGKGLTVHTLTTSNAARIMQERLSGASILLHREGDQFVGVDGSTNGKGYAEIYRLYEGAKTEKRVYQSARWRNSWDIIQPYEIGSTDYVLLYDKTLGNAAIYSMDTDGTLGSEIKGYTRWRKTWDQMVPVDINGKDYILFYDRLKGQGIIYQFNSDGTLNMTPKHRYNNFRKTWSQIVTFDRLGKDYLLFYDRQKGVGEFYRLYSDGRLSETLKTYTNWRRTWDQILTYDVQANDFLIFYDRERGQGAVYSLTAGGILDREIRTYSGWRKTWYNITPLKIGGNGYLMFYDRIQGEGALYPVRRDGLLGDLTKKYNNWRTTWDFILPFQIGGKDFLYFYESKRVPLHTVHKQYGSTCGPSSLNPVVEYLGRTDHDIRLCLSKELTPLLGEVPMSSNCYAWPSVAVDVGYKGSTEHIMYLGYYRQRQLNPEWKSDASNFISDGQLNTDDPANSVSYREGAFYEIRYDMGNVQWDPRSQTTTGDVQKWLRHSYAVGWLGSGSGPGGRNGGLPYVANLLATADGVQDAYAVRLELGPGKKFRDMAHLKAVIKGFIDHGIPMVIAVERGGHFNTLIGYQERGGQFYIYTADPLDGWGRSYYNKPMRWRKILLNEDALSNRSGVLNSILLYGHAAGCGTSGWAENIDEKHRKSTLCGYLE